MHHHNTFHKWNDFEGFSGAQVSVLSNSNFKKENWPRSKDNHDNIRDQKCTCKTKTSVNKTNSSY